MNKPRPFFSIRKKTALLALGAALVLVSCNRGGMTDGKADTSSSRSSGLSSSASTNRGITQAPRSCSPSTAYFDSNSGLYFDFDWEAWNASLASGKSSVSVDVKYDEAQGRFIQFSVSRQNTRDAVFSLQSSVDGKAWSEPIIICEENCLPEC